MIKKSLMLLLWAGISQMVLAQAKPNFTVKGTLEGKPDGVVVLSYDGAGGKQINTSAAVKNGQFMFSGNIAHTMAARFYYKEEPYNEAHGTMLFLEPGKMQLTVPFEDFSKATLTGSATQTAYSGLEQIKKGIEQKYKLQLDSMRDEPDHEKASEIRERLAPFFEEMDQADYRFFDQHPQSYVTLWQLRFHSGDLPIEAQQKYYDKLGPALQKTAGGREIAAEIRKLRNGSPGSKAANFSAMDINGKKLSLSDYKGKYVLLDFWASWCVPCRKGNPHLKALYAQYKDKGIEFIGISDDDSNPAAWKKAVAKDDLPWRHVLRGMDRNLMRAGKTSDKDISEKYGIHSLPTKILINPEGMIIGRYGSEGDELDRMLEKSF
ncbi:TlpA disulfide reductase family protein [Chitinophaga defluvii]|uniref:TlpA disulfide reductase family protein n=1 Tax=Chitinophaga defluvii TaxID=3163343 RepID=A0ABV2T098_9BACT